MFIGVAENEEGIDRSKEENCIEKSGVIVEMFSKVVEIDESSEL